MGVWKGVEFVVEGGGGSGGGAFEVDGVVVFVVVFGVV